MSYSPRYDRGDWKCICDSCGRIVKASQLRQRWDGFMVDERCWEPRQPQDFVRGVADIQTPPFTRPEPSAVWNTIVSFLTTITTTLTTYVMRLFPETLTTTLTSVLSIVAIKFRGEPSTKAVDGSSVNSTTLG